LDYASQRKFQQRRKGGIILTTIHGMTQSHSMNI
jgi:hypothetical protein